MLPLMQLTRPLMGGENVDIRRLVPYHGRICTTQIGRARGLNGHFYDPLKPHPHPFPPYTVRDHEVEGRGWKVAAFILL